MISVTQDLVNLSIFQEAYPFHSLFVYEHVNESFIQLQRASSINRVELLALFLSHSLALCLLLKSHSVWERENVRTYSINEKAEPEEKTNTYIDIDIWQE